MTQAQAVVVGGSLSGMTTALALHDAGFPGEIRIVEAGHALPPDRPALTKQVLRGETEPELYRGAERLGETNIVVALGTRAVALEATTRELQLLDSSGQQHALRPTYLVIATGSVAKSLPPSMMDGLTPGAGGVFTVRDAGDALGLRSALAGNPNRVAIIGAGFIGAEIAASVRQRGHEVTMIEAAPQPLDRVLPSQVGATIADLHRTHGVDVRVNVGIETLISNGDDNNRAVMGLKLQNGEIIDADVVVLGVGAQPDLEWLRDSGLPGFGSASNPLESHQRVPIELRANSFCEVENQIFAVGDVLSWPHPRFDRQVRVEQWENAINSGAYVGKRIAALESHEAMSSADPSADATSEAAADTPADTPADDVNTTAGHDLHKPYDELPWFWSDQYDRKLQMVGLPDRADELYVIDGSLDEFRFVALLKRGDNCTGVITMNRPRHTVLARQQLNKSLSWVEMCAALGVEDPTNPADPTIPQKV